VFSCNIIVCRSRTPPLYGVALPEVLLKPPGDLRIAADYPDGAGPICRPVDLGDHGLGIVAETDTDGIAFLAQVSTGFYAGVEEALPVGSRP